MQSWRLEKYASALTSFAAHKWRVRPPPEAQSAAAQEMAVRQHLRVLAVMCTCSAPFDAWWRLCALRRHQRLRETRSAAAEALRASRLRTNVLDETQHRFNKQDATLRTIARRMHLRDAILAWAISALERKSRRRSPDRHLALWLRRWQRRANFRSASRAWLVRRARRRQFGTGFVALRAAAAACRWLRAQAARLEVARVLSAWRGSHRRQRWSAARAAVVWRRKRTSRLGVAVRSWHRFVLRRTRKGLVAHQDDALCTMLKLWGDSAHAAVRDLKLIPARADAEVASALCALGGGWVGGRGALEIAVAELAHHKRGLLDEQQAVRAARARGEGAAQRVSELFVMLRQQRSNLAALTAAVARSEAESICLQRAMHTAERQAAARAAHPIVSSECAAEFGVLPHWVEHIHGSVSEMAPDDQEKPHGAGGTATESPGSRESERIGSEVDADGRPSFRPIGRRIAASPSTTPPPTPLPDEGDAATHLGASSPSRHDPPAWPLLAQLIVSSEASMRARLQPAERQLGRVEERLLMMERWVARGIEAIRAQAADRAQPP